MSKVLDNITKFRTMRNWTEYQLSEKTGIPQTTISSWYRKNLTPTISSLERICQGFGITMAQFFAEDDEPVSLTAEQRKLIEQWGSLSEQQRSLLSNLMKELK